jgi:hypothetical protein
LSALAILAYFVDVCWLGRRLRRTRGLEFELMALGMSGYLLFSPLSWRWLVFFWVPIALTRMERPRVSLAIWALLALATRVPFPNDGASAWGVFTWASLALFWMSRRNVTERIVP